MRRRLGQLLGPITNVGFRQAVQEAGSFGLALSTGAITLSRSDPAAGRFQVRAP